VVQYAMPLWILSLLAACGDLAPSDDASTPPAPVAPVPEAPVTPTVGLDCPEGTTQEEARRDDGIERWCDRNGIQDGDYVRTYADGSRAASGSWDDNQEDGPWVWWHDNGQEKTRGKYIKGRQAGSWTWYYANGNREKEGDYLQGREAGLWTYWYESGRRKEEGLFHNGMKNGTWSYSLDDEGNSLVRTEKWSNGVLVSTETAPVATPDPTKAPNSGQSAKPEGSK